MTLEEIARFISKAQAQLEKDVKTQARGLTFDKVLELIEKERIGQEIVERYSFNNFRKGNEFTFGLCSEEYSLNLSAQELRILWNNETIKEFAGAEVTDLYNNFYKKIREYEEKADL